MPTHAEPASRRLRALFVEDSADDFELMVGILSRAGWDVEGERVESSAAMQHALAAKPWDLVIADHSLPQLSSREALRLAKQTQAETPVILVSGSIGEDAAVAALHAGADDCIHKDRLARLPPAVERSLAAAQTRRERTRAEVALRASLAELRALSAHLDQAIEAERAGFARDLHDQVGGTLTALRSEIESLRGQIASDPSLARRLHSIDHLVASALDASITLARALRPSMLDHGIHPALEWQARQFEERTGTCCRVSCNVEETVLAVEQSTVLYRIFQEALTNIAKHAKAARVDAEIFINAASITLEVRDDGQGFAAAALEKPSSFGVRGMHERVRGLGGWLDLSSRPGEGTTLMVSIPREKRSALSIKRSGE